MASLWKFSAHLSKKKMGKSVLWLASSSSSSKLQAAVSNYSAKLFLTDSGHIMSPLYPISCPFLFLFLFFGLVCFCSSIFCFCFSLVFVFLWFWGQGGRGVGRGLSLHFSFLSRKVVFLHIPSTPPLPLLLCLLPLLIFLFFCDHDVLLAERQWMDI